MFAELDPHYFIVGNHEQQEPTISTNEITFEDGEPITFTITNNTTEPFELTAINEQQTSYLSFTYEELPVTLQVGESFEVAVSVNVMVKGYVTTGIEIVSSLATQVVLVNIPENILDQVSELSVKTKLYPNPTTGNFTVEGLNVAKVEVYNLVGQKVHEEQGKVININASNWNKGIYLVSITDVNDAVETKKLVVK